MSEQHPGWTNRIKLDPDQTKAQGEPYIDACRMVLHDVLLRNWADDPRGAQWHPDASYRVRLEVEGEPPGHTTWLVGHMGAVYRPEDAPPDVLDHEHTEECEHVIVSSLLSHCCDVCGNQYIGFRLCAKRCVATGYAVMRLMQSYASFEANG